MFSVTHASFLQEEHPLSLWGWPETGEGQQVIIAAPMDWSFIFQMSPFRCVWEVSPMRHVSMSSVGLTAPPQKRCLWNYLRNSIMSSPPYILGLIAFGSSRRVFASLTTSDLLRFKIRSHTENQRSHLNQSKKMTIIMVMSFTFLYLCQILADLK